MKKMIFAAMVAILSFGAFAADPVEGLIEIDGKFIQITDIDNTIASSEKKLPVEKYADGIYIVARSGPGSARLSNAEAVIKERFVALGYKIVDDLKDASLAIQFFAGGSLQMVRADQAKAQAINGGKISGGIATAAGSMAANGMSGAGALIGLLIPQDEEAILEGGIEEKPIIKTWFGNERIASSVPKGEYSNIIEVEYSLPEEKEKQATQDTILKMAVDQWIKRYMTTNHSDVTQ